MAQATVQQQINALYISSYGRAADAGGYPFWVNSLAAHDPALGLTLANAGTIVIPIADAIWLGQQFVLTQSTFFQQTYGNLNDLQFVNALYVNIGGSAGDAPGVNYWFTKLQTLEGQGLSNLQARAQIMGEFAHDLLSYDIVNSHDEAAILRTLTYQNKVAVSEAYEAASVNNPILVGHLNNNVPDAGYLASQRAIDGVTWDSSTVSIATQNIQDAISTQNVNEIQPVPQIINITDNVGGVVQPPLGPNGVTTGGATVEGNTITFTLNTHSVPDGTVEQYTLSGSATAGQITIPTSGTLTVQNGHAFLSVNTLANILNGVDTTLTLTVTGLKFDGVTPFTTTDTVTIHNASQSVSVAPNPVTEGGLTTFTVSTSGITPNAVAGLQETWTLSGTALSQVTGPHSGTVTLDNNGKATVDVQTAAIDFNGGTKSLTITFSSGAQGTVTVNEGTQTVSVNPTPILEGASTVFTIDTSGVAPGSVDGLVQGWHLTGTVAALSQVLGPTSGTVALDASGHATVNLQTIANNFNGGTQSITLVLDNGAITPPQATVTVVNGTQSLSAAPNPVPEGSTVNITVTTNNVATGALDGVQQQYVVTGAGINQIPVAERSGFVTLNQNGSGVISLHTLATVFNTVVDPTITVTLVNGATVQPSTTITIDEVAVMTVTDNGAPGVPHNTVIDGNTVTFTIKVTGVDPSAVAGQSHSWTLSGDDATLQQVTTSHSGTIVLDSNGQATVTVGTDLSNSPLPFGGGDLTLSIDNIFNASDTVTIVVPSILYFGPGPRAPETLTGGNSDTTFVSVVDYKLLIGPAPDNTFFTGDTANGNANYWNTWKFYVIDSSSLFGHVINPQGVNINKLDVQNNDLFFNPTYFDLQKLDQTLVNSPATTPLGEITVDGSHNVTWFNNVQNVLRRPDYVDNTYGGVFDAAGVLNVFNNDTGFNVWPLPWIRVQMVDRLVTAPNPNSGPSENPLILNLLNNNTFINPLLIAVETTADFDTTSALLVNNLGGTNNIVFDGLKVVQSMYFTDTNFGDVTTLGSLDETFVLSYVDTQGIHPGNTIVVGNPFGLDIDAYDHSPDLIDLKIKEGPGNNTFFIDVHGGAGLHIDPSNGNNSAYIDTLGNFHTIWIDEGTGDDILDIDRADGASNYETIRVEYGIGGIAGVNALDIETGTSSTVTVITHDTYKTQNIAIRGWNTVFSGDTIYVTVGDAWNKIYVDTWTQLTADWGSHVEINAGDGWNDIDVVLGYNSFSQIIVGNGNNNINVQTQDATSIIQIGDGNNTIVFNNNNASGGAGFDVVSITSSGGPGTYADGDNNVTVTVGHDSSVTEEFGSGANTITNNLWYSGSVLNLTTGLPFPNSPHIPHGNQTIVVNILGGGSFNTVNVTTGAGDDSVTITGAFFNTINVSTNYGNDRVQIDWLYQSSNTLDGGPDTSHLYGLPPGQVVPGPGQFTDFLWKDGDTLATYQYQVNGAGVNPATIRNFENLEILDRAFGPGYPFGGNIDTQNLGPFNNIRQVIFDQGYTSFGSPFNTLALRGLDPYGEVQLLASAGGVYFGGIAGDPNLNNNELEIQINGALGSVGDSSSLVLNSQEYIPGLAPFYDVYFGTVEYNPNLISFAPVEILNIHSQTPFFFPVTNHVQLVDVGIKTLNIWHANDPDANLNIDGSVFAPFGPGFGPLTLVDAEHLSGPNSDPSGSLAFTAGIHFTSPGFGNQDVTFLAGRAGSSELSFGGGDNFVRLGDGNNQVWVGNFDLPGPATGEPGGINTLIFGNGSNTIHLSAYDRIGIPGIDNGSGSTITFGSHVFSSDLIEFNSNQNSAFTTPDIINGFHTGDSNFVVGHDVLDFDNITNFSGALTYSSYLNGYHVTGAVSGEATFVTVSSEGAVAAAIAGEKASFGTSEFNMVFVSSTGNLYIDSGNLPTPGLNPPVGNFPQPILYGAADGTLNTASFGDMQIHLTGVSDLESIWGANIHIV